MALGWEAPTSTVNNSFSATLIADGALTGVDISDFRIKGVDNSTVTLDNNNTTLTQVDTNSWRLDIELTGTYDADYFVRVRRNQVQEDGTNVPSSNLDSTPFRIDSSFTPPPARPIIGMIATPQNFVVNTDFTLTVTITGINTSAGDTVKVLGLLERFAYAYAGTTLTITGRPTRLLSNALLKIVATNDDGPTNKDVIFNVVPGAPVISQATAPTLYTGYPYSFFVPITNRPPKPTVEGLWTGLIYDRHENDQGQKGVLISGIVAPGDFTVTSGEFTVNAPYAGGPVSRTFQHDIGKATLYGLSNSTVRRIQFNGDGEDITSDLSFTLGFSGYGHNYLFDVDENYIYVERNLSPRQIHRASRTTGDGQTSTLMDLTGNLNYDPTAGVAVDDDTLYVGDSNTRRIYLYNKSTGAYMHYFRVPSTSNFRFSGIVVHGDSIVLLSWSADALLWFSKNTGNNVLADIEKTVNLSSDIDYISDITILGNNIYITDRDQDKIYRVDALTADGGTAEYLETSGVPSGFRDMNGIAVYAA